MFLGIQDLGNYYMSGVRKADKKQALELKGMLLVNKDQAVDSR
jgi:hypothetical protein